MITKRGYYGIFAALLALTAVTVGASRVDLGMLNMPVALAIAGAKAALVVLFFMHVRYESRLVGVFAAAGLFWLGILVALTFSDYLTRTAVTGYPSAVDATLLDHNRHATGGTPP